MNRFGRPVVPREWLLAPLFAIKETVEKIKNGTITDYVYDPSEASLKPRQVQDGNTEFRYIVCWTKDNLALGS